MAQRPNPGPFAAFPPATRLLIPCARPDACADETDARRIRALAGADGVDWDRFMRLVDWHDIAPSVYANLAAAARDVLPAAIDARLRAMVRAAANRNIHLTAELRTVVGLLEDAGIPALPYKGPALAALLYGERTLRTAMDIDVLVRPGDATRALALLEERGYPRRQRLTPEQVALESRYDYNRALRSNATDLPLELHWGLSIPHFTRLDVSELFDRPGPPLTVGGRPMRSPTTEDLLVMLAVHGFKHRWRCLKWVGDIDRLIRTRPLDGPTVIERARSWGNATMLRTALGLARDLFETPMASGLTAGLDSDATARRLVRRARRDLMADPFEPPSRVTQFARWPWHLASRGYLRRRAWLALALNERDLAWLPPSLRVRPLGYLARVVRVVLTHGLGMLPRAAPPGLDPAVDRRSGREVSVVNP